MTVFSPERRDEVVAEAIKMRDKWGLKWGDIADHFGVTKAWLRTHVVATGYKNTGRLATKASAQNLARARELRKQGLRWKAIERIMGINQLTLRSAVYLDDKARKENG